MNIDEFHEKLILLNPNDQEFISLCYELLESTEEIESKYIISSIFIFFENHQLDDCGCPGALVYFIEIFYLEYKNKLLESMRKLPSFSAIFIINRILNSKLSISDRKDYLSSLSEIANNLEYHELLRAEASELIKFQGNKKLTSNFT